MKFYTLTTQAQIDIDQIFKYTVRKWGGKKAVEYAHGFKALASKLASTPNIGNKKEGLSENLLFFPYISHIICYKQSKQGIVIVRVLHKNMDIKSYNLLH